MSLSINTIGSTSAGVPMPPSLQKAEAGQSSFASYLMDSLSQVNSMQAEANSAVESLATGGEVNPAEVLTAVQKADLAFRLTMQIRNKLVAAYQEIQNIRI
jgi:flagellar hook-basal body complex protein FliE